MVIMVKVFRGFPSSATVTEENNLKQHSLVVFAQPGKLEIIRFFVLLFLVVLHSVGKYLLLTSKYKINIVIFTSYY